MTCTSRDAFSGPGFVVVQSYEWRSPKAEGKGGVLDSVGDVFT